MTHAQVTMVACIAAMQARWDEQRLLIVVKKPSAESLTCQQLRTFFLNGKIAK